MKIYMNYIYSLLLLLCVVYCYSADVDSVAFPDDIVLSDDISDKIEPIPQDQIIVADPTLPIDVQSEVTVPVPLFGPLKFKIGDRPEEGLFIALPDRDLGPLHIRDTKLRFLHGIISFKSFVTISFPGFSLTGEMGLRELIYDTKKKGYRAVFGISFKDQANQDQLKIHCGPDLDIVFNEMNLVIEPQDTSISMSKNAQLTISQSFKGGQKVAGPSGYMPMTDVESARMYFVAKSTFFKQPINLYVAKTEGRWIIALKTTNIYPFASSAVPDEVKKIRLYNIVAQFESFAKGQSIRFVGEGDLFNIKVEAELFFGSQEDSIGGKNKTCYLVRFSVGRGNKISTLIPQLKGTLYDDFIVKDLSVIASSDEYKDPSRGVTFVQGINFFGGVGLPSSLDTDLGRVRTLVGVSDIVLFGGIGLPDPKKSRLLIRIPEAAIRIVQSEQDNFKFKYFDLEIVGNPDPFVSLAVGLDMRPSSKDEWLTFVGRITVGYKEALLAATLQGMWRNPFGIKPVKPIEVGNAALQLNINYKFVATTGIPVSGLGMKLELHVGKTIVDAAVKADFANPQNSMIAAELSKLELQDLIDFASLFTGAPIQIGNLPIIRFEDIKMYIVPVEQSIGEFTFKQGVRFAAKLFVSPGAGQPNIFAAGVDIAVYEKGTKGMGYCQAFDLGPIRVTGAGPDRIYGTADDGPMVDFEFFKDYTKFYLTGLVLISDIIKSQTEITIDQDEFSMMFDNKIKDILDSKVAISYSLKDLNAYIMIDFSQNYIAMAQKVLNDYANAHNVPPLIAMTQDQKQSLITNVSGEVKQVQKKYAMDEYVKTLEQKVTPKDTQMAEKVDVLMAKQAEKMKQLDERMRLEQKRMDEAFAQAQQKADEAMRAAQQRSDAAMSAAEKRAAEAQKKAEAAMRVAQQKADEALKKAQNITIRTPVPRTKTDVRPIKREEVVQPVASTKVVSQPKVSTPPSQTFEQFFTTGFDNLGKFGQDISTKVIDPFAQEVTKTFAVVGNEIEKTAVVAGKEIEKNAIGQGARAMSFLLSQCNITRFYFKGSVIDMVQGIFPRVELEGCIGGTKKSVVFQFDLRSPEQSAQTVSTAILDLFTRPGSGSC